LPNEWDPLPSGPNADSHKRGLAKVLAVVEHDRKTVYVYY